MIWFGCSTREMASQLVRRSQYGVSLTAFLKKYSGRLGSNENMIGRGVSAYQVLVDSEPAHPERLDSDDLSKYLV